MSKKCLIGLMNKKIVLVDMETTVKAKKQAFREGCDNVIIAEFTELLRKKLIDEIEVSMSDFTGIEL